LRGACPFFNTLPGAAGPNQNILGKGKTMNAKFFAWSCIGVLVVAGCIPSLNPIYLSENLVFDPSVIGVWKQPGSKETWQFSKRDGKSYHLVYTNEAGEQGRFIAHLADIQGNRFLDLYPDVGQQDATDFYKFHLVPIHTIYLVRRTEPNLELAATNYPWLDDYLTDHPSAIEHSTFNGRKFITAPTEQLQPFVVANVSAFTALVQLERVSAGP
jgi:hypothetical protein